MNLKNYFPENVRDNENIHMLKDELVKGGIPTANANNVKRLVVESIEKTCAGFSIEKRKEDFETFLFMVAEYGAKQAVKKYTEYIEDRDSEFSEFFEKFAPPQ